MKAYDFRLIAHIKKLSILKQLVVRYCFIFNQVSKIFCDRLNDNWNHYHLILRQTLNSLGRLFLSEIVHLLNVKHDVLFKNWHRLFDLKNVIINGQYQLKCPVIQHLLGWQQLLNYVHMCQKRAVIQHEFKQVNDEDVYLKV